MKINTVLFSLKPINIFLFLYVNGKALAKETAKTYLDTYDIFERSRAYFCLWKPSFRVYIYQLWNFCVSKKNKIKTRRGIKLEEY